MEEVTLLSPAIHPSLHILHNQVAIHLNRDIHLNRVVIHSNRDMVALLLILLRLHPVVVDIPLNLDSTQDTLLNNKDMEGHLVVTLLPVVTLQQEALLLIHQLEAILLIKEPQQDRVTQLQQVVVTPPQLVEHTLRLEVIPQREDKILLTKLLSLRCMQT